MNKTNNKNWPILLVCAFVLSAFSIGVSVFLRINTQIQYKYYSNNLKAGDIANTTILAKNSFDIIDEEATETARMEAAKAVLPVFSVSFESNIQSIEAMEEFSDNLSSPEVAAAAIEMLKDVLNEGYISYIDLLAVSNEGYDKITFSSDGSVHDISGALSEKTLREYLRQDTKPYYSVLSAIERIEATEAVVTVIQTNYFYDGLLTSVKRLNASEAVEVIKTSIVKDQVLIEKDKVITQNQLDLLLLVSRQDKINTIETVGKFMLCLVCFFIEIGAFSYVIKPENRHYLQYLLILTFGSSLSFIFSYFSLSFASLMPVMFIQVYMPTAFMPILMTMITGKKRGGFLASFIMGTGMLMVPGADYNVLFYCIISGFISVVLVRILHKRSDFVLQWFLNIISNCCLSLLFLLLSPNGFSGLLLNLIVCVAVVTLAYLVNTVLLPVIEKIFNLPTVFRLHELAYGESKLIKKLYSVAPGTYSHSKSVASLADTACQSIGANGLLASVGALYHDVGKIDHPEYFIENQNGNNKHDEINPSLSASIIKNHVKVGAEKARNEGLPEEVVDIVANHHGNDVISFFYNEAKNDDEFSKKQEIQKSDFSYNAEIPSTKECAVVMLADSIEAAARTIVSPSASKFAKLIEQIILKKIENGQLDNSGLTFNDIKLISNSFLKTLSAQYHSRIEYHDEDSK